MTVGELIKLIEILLKAGLSAIDIVERLCANNGGEAIPTLEEFKAETERLKNLPPLPTK